MNRLQSREKKLGWIYISRLIDSLTSHSAADAASAVQNVPPAVASPSAPPMEMIAKQEQEERKASKKHSVAPECPVCISNYYFF